EVQKAMELDPNLGEAYAQMGWIKTIYDWDWSSADADYKRALQLEPANADVVWGAANLAGTLGRFDEAITLDRKAIELDPLGIYTHFHHGLMAYYDGRLDEAEAAVRKVLELRQQYANAHQFLGRIYIARSKPLEALTEMQKESESAVRGQA